MLGTIKLAIVRLGKLTVDPLNFWRKPIAASTDREAVNTMTTAPSTKGAAKRFDEVAYPLLLKHLPPAK